MPETPVGPAEEAVARDEVGTAMPPQFLQGLSGPPPKQTQTITVNLPSTAEERESDIQIVVDIVQEGPDGTVNVTVDSHGVTPNAEEYNAISQILSSLV